MSGIYSFDESIISDLHKDAYGFRPGSYFWDNWKNSGKDGKQRIWDDLCKELDGEIERNRLAQARAVAEFEKLISRHMQHGAQTRYDAIRWIVQSLGLDELDLRYGGSLVCYEMGLPYSMETEFNDICREMYDSMAVAA